MGWMLFFTVTKHQVFDRALDDDMHWKLIKGGRHDELLRQRGGAYLSKQLTHLLFKMLHPDPRHRPTANECLEHPWFKGTNTRMGHTVGCLGHTYLPDYTQNPKFRLTDGRSLDVLPHPPPTESNHHLNLYYPTSMF